MAWHLQVFQVDLEPVPQLLRGGHLAVQPLDAVLGLVDAGLEAEVGRAEIVINLVIGANWAAGVEETRALCEKCPSTSTGIKQVMYITNLANNAKVQACFGQVDVGIIDLLKRYLGSTGAKKSTL